MKKLVLILLLCFSMSLLLIGCSKDNSSPDQELTSSTNEIKSESKPVEKESNVSAASLTGQALIDSLDVTRAKTLYIKGISTNSGQTITSTTYIEGENMRIESEYMGMTQVMIYNAKDAATYTYTIGEEMGYVFYDDDDDWFDDEDEDDFDIMSFEAIFDDLDGTLISAERMTYNGYDVIYYETSTEMTGEKYVTKQWVAVDYWHPIKMESYYNGVLNSSYEAVELSSKLPNTPKLFEPPSDIEFINFDSMFDFSAP